MDDTPVRPVPISTRRRRLGIRQRRRWYQCPPGCWPARLASIYDELPWTHSVTLTARDGEFVALWNAWRGLKTISSMGDSSRPWWQPFWIAVLADHHGTPPWSPGAMTHEEVRINSERVDGRVERVPYTRSVPKPGVNDAEEYLPWSPSSKAHAHLLVGGVPAGDLLAVLETWPALFHVERVGARWGALHYVFSQGETKPWLHARDPLSYCHALLCPPLESSNLELVLQTSRERSFARWGRRGRLRSRKFRHERAQKAARARWAKTKTSTVEPGIDPFVKGSEKS